MAVFKCKMCGGSLEVQDGITVCECEYCGSKQTIPSNTDENIRALYNRANVLIGKLQNCSRASPDGRILMKNGRKLGKRLMRQKKTAFISKP